MGINGGAERHRGGTEGDNRVALYLCIERPESDKFHFSDNGMSPNDLACGPSRMQVYTHTHLCTHTDVWFS